MDLLPLRKVIALTLCGYLLGQSANVDVQNNPAWPTLRALIQWHGLQDRSDTIVAIWMSVGGEECRKAMRDAGIQSQAATEICAVENSARDGRKAGSGRAAATSAAPKTQDKTEASLQQSAPQPEAKGSQGLTNESLIKMVKASLSEDVILSLVQSQPGTFSIAPDDLIALKSAGISDRIISAVLDKVNGASRMPAEEAKATSAPKSNGGQFVLHDGTPIRLRLSRNLSSADAQVGESVDFEVLEDVRIDDVLVVARGGTTIATVTEAQPKKRMARGGKLGVTIDYVRLVDGGRAALRAVKETKGGGHTGAMTGGIVATAIVLPVAAPFFLFMHGKDTVIPKGTEITAYVNGEIALERSHFAGR
ncbi:MAG: hypothetical protein IT167_28215 [Bryobacterales bacterium]|nr:hypothetical protein [Bryobacterales bacterium]